MKLEMLTLRRRSSSSRLKPLNVSLIVGLQPHARFLSLLQKSLASCHARPPPSSPPPPDRRRLQAGMEEEQGGH